MTISVCLTALNEQERLPTQLEAIVPQLADDDELIMLDDGSTDETYRIMQDWHRKGDIVIRSARPSGVCAAYNRVAGEARNDLLHLVSANDVVQPGAYDAIKTAARRYPGAKVFFGDIAQWDALNWLPTTGYLSRPQVRQVWYSKQSWNTHGAAVFIRRNYFSPGYLPQLRWTADWFQAFVLAIRCGCVYLSYQVSSVNFLPGQYSSLNANDDAYNEVVRETEKLVYSSEYSDIRESLLLYDDITHWLTPRCPKQATLVYP